MHTQDIRKMLQKVPQSFDKKTNIENETNIWLT